MYTPVLCVTTGLFPVQNAGECSRLIGPVYVGSEMAAVANSSTDTFTHLLCVADELDEPDGWTEDSGVTFVKVQLSLF